MAWTPSGSVLYPTLCVAVRWQGTCVTVDTCSVSFAGPGEWWAVGARLVVVDGGGWSFVPCSNFFPRPPLHIAGEGGGGWSACCALSYVVLTRWRISPQYVAIVLYVLQHMTDNSSCPFDVRPASSGRSPGP